MAVSVSRFKLKRAVAYAALCQQVLQFLSHSLHTLKAVNGDMGGKGV
jgi:hypothetical protein